MSEVLLIEIQFNSKSWYLSEEGHVGKNYYAPYLSETPTLELGEVKGGHIGVRLGDLSIANRPNDRFSPFSIFGGGYAKLLSNPNQRIPVQIYWQQNKLIESIFDGTMYLNSFDTDGFNFLLEDKSEDIDLLSEARDFNSDFVSVNSISITGEGVALTALVAAPDHGLDTGDLIRVRDCPTADLNTFNTTQQEIVEVPITKVDDNFFRYTLINTVGGTTVFRRSSEYLMETFTKKPQPFSFGIVSRKKDIIQTNDASRQNLGEVSGIEFSNPNLRIDIPVIDGVSYPLRLFDDGVLVGTNDSARGGNLSFGLDITAVEKQPNYLKLTTSGNHDLIVGSTVALGGFLPKEVNTSLAFYVVSDILSATEFKVYAKFTTDIDVQINTISGTISPTGLPSGRYYVKQVNSDTVFTVYYNSTTYTITTSSTHGPVEIGLGVKLNVSGSSVSVKSYVETPGEYFGVDREPTTSTIFTRAYFNDLLTWNNVPASSDPTYSNYVRNLGGDSGIDVTSNDGTVLVGTALVSGVSSNGRSLAEFFEFIAKKLNVTNVDFSAAPDASTTYLQLWETSQTKAIEYAGEISYAANHLFEIKGDILRAIDRSYIPENFIQINNWEIIEASYKMPTPTKALRAKWTENIAQAKEERVSLTTREESVMISNMASGEILDITPVSENPDDIEKILLKIRAIINKNVITLKVGRIRSDIKVGTRVKANRDEDGITIDMIVRTIKYEFKDLSTEIVGDGSLSVIEQDQIY